MKKLKYFIILLIVILVVTIGVLVYITFNTEQKPDTNTLQQGGTEDQEQESVEPITPEEIKNEVAKSLVKQIEYKDINSFLTTEWQKNIILISLIRCYTCRKKHMNN